MVLISSKTFVPTHLVYYITNYYPCCCWNVYLLLKLLMGGRRYDVLCSSTIQIEWSKRDKVVEVKHKKRTSLVKQQIWKTGFKKQVTTEALLPLLVYIRIKNTIMLKIEVSLPAQEAVIDRMQNFFSAESV